MFWNKGHTVLWAHNITVANLCTNFFYLQRLFHVYLGCRISSSLSFHPHMSWSPHMSLCKPTTTGQSWPLGRGQQSDWLNTMNLKPLKHHTWVYRLCSSECLQFCTLHRLHLLCTAMTCCSHTVTTHTTSHLLMLAAFLTSPDPFANAFEVLNLILHHRFPKGRRPKCLWTQYDRPSTNQSSETCLTSASAILISYENALIAFP